MIEPTRPTQPDAPPRVNRILHFWNDGFSVDDGDLFPTANNPQNAAILEGIQQGRAPLSIMNVMPGQEVDVEIKQHSENYVRPKAKYKPFGGQGNRLGSPTPGDSSARSVPGAFPTSSSSATAVAAVKPQTKLDESQPTVSLRVQLSDGTRLPARFNTTNTIEDVYAFVRGARPGDASRPWTLMTTFPSKEFKDKSQVLGDIAEFKRGGVVVQRYT